MELNLTRILDLVSDLADLVSDLREKAGVLIFSPGMYGGLYGQNLPYKFKKSYGDFQNCNFEKSHRTTGPTNVADF